MSVAVKPKVEERFPRSLVRQRAEAAATVAREFADDVDRNSRFPAEALEVLKEGRLLGLMIPVELGGEGASAAEVADVCSILGQACASTAMIFAMHQIKTSSLVTHGQGSAWHRGFMQQIAEKQLLLASATTEGGVGGDMRSSICAIEPEEDASFFQLRKEANVISYGMKADAILITARRNAEAPSSDQLMAVIQKHQYVLEPTIAWDTLGMRGTCSEGFRFAARAPREQILDKPFAEIAAQSMLAMAHILWSSVWYGIAADAVARARACVRAEARRQPGATPAAARRLTQTVGALQQMKADVLDGLRRFEAVKGDEAELSSVAFAVAMNNLKVTTSTAVADIVRQAMLVIGIGGYRNDGAHSVGRHMRDSLSAALMVNNDRILGNVEKLMPISRNENGLLG
ncbi:MULTISPECIES: acyl-CoA dehydrogenase family protein [unclassified Beijerinckia]|uniref:acyl-CoA dehydrogenase family protein n=1 Tax=unclassified Beijerinckia TaxID=2638183 RepID=UPI0008989A07|nr:MULTISPECIES: acyl-CoA dehydrogenase family protein [unclassified Beijerinckia]MDH7797286.1 acyl-CoA dehydrogenase [Beijerinckia sp. GAS462]SEC79464.1 acyl-CoA dehydrogenase [Beijerinckia sp. 28-YEA-48]